MKKKEKQKNKRNLLVVLFVFLFIFIFIDIGMFSLKAQTFSGAYTPSFGGGYRIIGPSANPQFTNPSFISPVGYTPPSLYWPKFGKEDCYSRQDFVLQIPPGGCTPAVVRSDLLEEQPVPVFCKVMAIKTNPLIEIGRVRSLHFKGKYPKGVSSMSYFPARAGIITRRDIINTPIDDNIGYVLIVLSPQKTEKEMPDSIEGTITAVIDYEIGNAWGIGETNFYVKEMSDEEWARNYKKYGFWNGRGYIRADRIEGDRVKLSVYRDADTRISTVTLRKKETSKDIYLSGFYCSAGLNLRVESIDAPVETALLQIDDKQVQVAKGDRILDGKCSIADIRTFGGEGGSVTISCPFGRFELSLKAGKALFNVSGKKREYKVGEKIRDEKIKDNIFLAYTGKDSEGELFAILINDSFSNTETAFADKEVYGVISRILLTQKKPIDELRESIEKAVKLQYMKKTKRRVDKKVSIIILTEKENKIEGFPISLENVFISQDKDWSKETNETALLAKKYYDKAIKAYQDLYDLYPTERDNEEVEAYASQGLYKAAQLSEFFDMPQKANDFYLEILNNYPDSDLAKDAEQKKDLLTKYDSSEAKVFLQVDSGHFITLLDVRKPTLEEINIVVLINGDEYKLTPGDEVPVEGGTIRLEVIRDDYIGFRFIPKIEEKKEETKEEKPEEKKEEVEKKEKTEKVEEPSFSVNENNEILINGEKSRVYIEYYKPESQVIKIKSKYFFAPDKVIGKIEKGKITLDEDEIEKLKNKGYSNETLNNIEKLNSYIYDPKTKKFFLKEKPTPPKSVSREVKKTLKIGEQVEVNKNLVKLISINLKKQAKISIIPKVRGTRTESNFTFKIGIEKRAIELSPERTEKIIKNIEKQIKAWQKVNDNLGKLIKGMKGACFATAAALTVKNLVTGLGGKAMARTEVMTGPGGWNDFCEDLVSSGKASPYTSKTYSSIEKCLLDHNSFIEEDVNLYAEKIKETNEELEEIQKEAGAKRTDILDLEGQVDPEKIRKLYYEKHFREFYNKNKEMEITLSNGEKKKLKEIIPDPEKATLSEMRDLITYSKIKDEGILANKVLKEKLGSSLLYTYEVNQYYQDYDALKEDVKDILGEKPAMLPIGSNGIVPTEMNTLTKEQADLLWLYSGDEVRAGTKVVTYKVPAGAVYRAGREGPNEIKDLQGKTIIITLEKSGHYYIPKNAYKAEKGRVTKMEDDKKSAFFAYLGERGMERFVEANPKAYENRMVGEPRVLYFEREPYKGLPAQVPFDKEKGWYVRLTYILSGVGRPYDESGRPVNYWICNVGPNGRIEFKKGRDDICRYYSGNIDSLDFPGLSSQESRRLVARAQQALAEAARQYGKKTVKIGRYFFETGVSFAGEEGRCSDFMSPRDCWIMFNVCDPVICPASRCDLGGKFRVDNVIQTGIIGSLALCLPNFKEGIYIPICLSGVHAGIEGYLSILNSTKACLKESLETGRNIGICDEIKSIYLCQFFWKQITPFANVLIPRLIQTLFFSQGTRGGGEYLTVEKAWENTQKAIDYFKNEYAVNSMLAFNKRSTQEVGDEVCKSFVSARYPTSKDFFDKLTEPDSPLQFHAWFSEDVLSTATVPPVSHYKVYYHIYAGKDEGAYYVVYLKDLPESNYIYTVGSYIVDRGYLPRGGSVDRARDFTAVSGFKQLCISVNGQEQCGFGKVSTSYFFNYLSDKYAEEQLKKEITTTKECISGKPSLLSLAQPNLQAGTEEIITPQLYNKGIIRVCSTYNPGKQVTPSGEFDTTNSTYDRWKDVGYCDTPKIRCWLDTESVKDVIKNLNIEKKVLEEVNIKHLGETRYLTVDESIEIAEKSKKFIDTLSLKDEITETEIEGYIGDEVKELNRLINLAPTNKFRAKGLYLLGNLYKKIAENLYEKIKRSEEIKKKIKKEEKMQEKRKESP